MSYNIIYADPPWSYRDKKKSGRTKCGAENHYDCLTVEELCSFPVSTIAADNAVLFLWTTFPLLLSNSDASLSPPGTVMEAWGFKYRTVGFVWIKTNANGSVWHGVGAYAKSNAEVCLMGVRGNVGRLMKDERGQAITTYPEDKLSVASNHVSSIVMSQRRKHSQKPTEVRDKIEQLFGDVPRVELFARSQSEGWSAMGEELNGLLIQEALSENTGS